MGKIIFELLTPILLMLYLIVDVLIPSFYTKWEYFWFFKFCFKSESKPSFEEEIKSAERAYKQAKSKMEHLKDSATDETKEAEKRLAQTKETLDNAKKKIENLKK